MGNEVNNMTDEQFKTYNQLLKLVEELTDDKKKEYKEKKNDIF